MRLDKLDQRIAALNPSKAFLLCFEDERYHASHRSYYFVKARRKLLLTILLVATACCGCAYLKPPGPPPLSVDPEEKAYEDEVLSLGGGQGYPMMRSEDYARFGYWMPPWPGN